jgi:ElaB/YqjD/DUF883 family membrane-anchored ribosome-binding protein
MNQNFLEKNIIEELGLETLPEEQKITLLEQMTTLVQKRVMLRIMEVLTEVEKDEFEKLLEEKGEDAIEIANFLREKIPNLDELVKEEIVKLKKEVIGGVEI